MFDKETFSGERRALWSYVNVYFSFCIAQKITITIVLHYICCHSGHRDNDDDHDSL